MFEPFLSDIPTPFSSRHEPTTIYFCSLLYFYYYPSLMLVINILPPFSLLLTLLSLLISVLLSVLFASPPHCFVILFPSFSLQFFPPHRPSQFCSTASPPCLVSRQSRLICVLREVLLSVCLYFYLYT